MVGTWWGPVCSDRATPLHPKERGRAFEYIRALFPQVGDSLTALTLRGRKMLAYTLCPRAASYGRGSSGQHERQHMNPESEFPSESSVVAGRHGPSPGHKPLPPVLGEELCSTQQSQPLSAWVTQELTESFNKPGRAEYPVLHKPENSRRWLQTPKATCFQLGYVLMNTYDTVGTLSAPMMRIFLLGSRLCW